MNEVLMFLKWQPRKIQRPEFGRHGPDLRDENGCYVYNGRGNLLRTCAETGALDVRWTAVVVESVRINGKPRQRHVVCLGSICESAIPHDTQRRFFWDKIDAALARERDHIPRADRRRIESAIADRVPRLTPAQRRASIKRSEAIMSAFEKRFGGRGGVT